MKKIILCFLLVCFSVSCVACQDIRSETVSVDTEETVSEKEQEPVSEVPKDSTFNTEKTLACLQNGYWCCPEKNGQSVIVCSFSAEKTSDGKYQCHAKEYSLTDEETESL